MKKILSVILAISFILSPLCVIGTSAEGKGDIVSEEIGIDIGKKDTGFESVSFEDVEIIEGTSGGFVGTPEDGYFYYDLNPVGTVYFTDGGSEDFTDGFLCGGNYYYAIFSGQSSSNPWGVGTHRVDVDIIDDTDRTTVYQTGFSVTITENPIASIFIGDYEIREGEDGYFTNDWDNDNNCETPEYFCYSYPVEGTVYYKDGTSEIFSYSIPLGDEYYGIRCDDGQNYYNQWGIGAHTVTASCFGGLVKCDFTVTVTENPIDRVVVNDVEIDEKLDGFFSRVTDEEGNLITEYFRYEFPITGTVYMKDGSSFDFEDSFSIGEDYYGISYSDNQYGNPWGLGDHTVKAHIGNMDCDFTVTVCESILERISVNDAVITEKKDCYKTTDWDDKNDCETPEYYRYYYPAAGTAYFKDGTSVEFEDSIEIGGKNYDIVRDDDQGYYNQWGIGTYKADAGLGKAKASFSVTVETNPIKNIVLNDAETYEGLGGYYRTDWEGNTYFCYSYRITGTVYLNDGTSFGFENGFELGDRYYDFGYSDDQSYENQWGIGAHTAHVECYGYEESFDLTVNVVESPVERIEVNDVEIIEHSNGYYDCDWDSETGEYTPEYFKYSYPVTGTVFFKDGTQKEFENGFYVSDMYCDIYTSDDQSYYNQWGIGTHTAKVEFAGAEDMTVTITESRVKNIILNDVSVIEGTSCYKSWDEYDGIRTPEYNHYSVPLSGTVFYKDGTSESFEYSVVVDGVYYSVSYYDDQSYYNQWGVGVHTIEYSVMGFSGEFSFEITESPAVDVDIEDVIILENSNRGTRETWDDETGGFRTYEVYEYSFDDFSVKMRDGRVVSSNGNGGIYIDGKYYGPSWSDDQSEENIWGIGKHTVSVSFMGIDKEVTVEIVKSPIKSLKVEDVNVFENTNGYIYQEYDWDTGIHNEYFRYEPDSTYTVTLNDGSTVTGKIRDGDAEFGGVEADIAVSSDQSYANQWGIGKHKMTVTIAGTSAEFTVNVIASPIKKITVDPIKLYENYDGYITGDYVHGPEGWHLENEWYYYDWFMSYTATAELFDGRIIKSDINIPEEYSGGGIGGFSPSFLIDGAIFNISFDDDQSYENQWGIGKHIVTAHSGGASCEVEITVAPFPIKSLSVSVEPLIKDVDGYFTGERIWDEKKQDYVIVNKWYRYDITKKAEITATLTDGTTVKAIKEASPYAGESEAYMFRIEADGAKFNVYFTDDQYEKHWGVGSHKATVNCGNMEYDFTVKVIEDPDAPVSALPGDINGDGKVNAVDSNLMKQIILDSMKPNEKEFAAADINGDGKVNAVDANLQKQIILGD